MSNKVRVLSVLFLLMAALGVLVIPLHAQDDEFTCDNGPNDVVNAAQAAFDASELDEAHDLTVLALYICPDGSVKRLEAQVLKNDIESFRAETEFLFDLTFYEVRDRDIGGRTYRNLGTGEVSGPQINGEVPDLGVWFITRSDGQRDVEAQIIIRTDDGELIYMSFQGLFSNSRNDRVFARFETGAEEYDWLNQTVAIGAFSLEPQFHYRFYTIK